MTTISPIATADAAILARVLGPDRDTLSPEAAQALLQLRFDRGDLERLHELTTRNQDDALNLAERAELESYLRVSSFLDLLQARARLTLKSRT